MAISKKTWTGTAKETVSGTPVTPATKYHPTKTVFKGAKKREYLNEERGDRNANYGVVDSVRQTTIEMKGPYYPDVTPIVLWGAFGLPTTSQPAPGTDPTVYKHTFALADVPPSYTIARSLDAKAYKVPYCVLDKFSLTFNADGKLFEYDASWLGMFAQIYSSPPSATYSTVLPMAGYAPTIKFVDNVVSNDVQEMTIEYDQKLTLWYPANGSPDFVTVYFGERSIKVSMTARFDDDTLYNRWRNNTMDALTFDIQGTNISNSYNHELNIVLPNLSWDTMEHDTGKDNVLIKAKGTAVVPSGASLLTGYVQNTVASYTT